MHILIAPNAFKNSLDAQQVAEAIYAGLQQSSLGCTCTCFPVADGGDGTGKLLLQKLNGRIIAAQVHDPLFRKTEALFGLIDNDKTAVIELADASGLRLLQSHEYDPLHATTFGTGELIKSALEKGVEKIILCIGGSATVDGGAGILQALGIRFLDADKNILHNIPEDLIHLFSIDTSGLDKRIFNCEIIILCDVKNKLLGENGAAKIFAPQKGAKENEVEKLEAALAKFAEITHQQTGKDITAITHGGASGGVAAGLSAFLNAQLVNGIEYFLTLTNFQQALQKADLVITGEGSIDEQTLQGKGPFGVAQIAKEKNIPVIGIAGKIPHINDPQLQQYFTALFTITNEPIEISIALQQTKENLIRTACAIGNILAINK